MKRGHIDEFHWIECDKPSHLVLCEIVRGLAPFLMDCRALNVSWDSGVLLPSDAESEGWTFEQGHAISPATDHALLNSWPYSGGFDEWYFFTQLPADLSLIPYCNWGGGTSISDWPSIAGAPTGVDLGRQLRQSRPHAVVGEGYKLFAISVDIELVNEFGRLVTGV